MLRDSTSDRAVPEPRAKQRGWQTAGGARRGGHRCAGGTHRRREGHGDDLQDRHTLSIPVDAERLRAEGVEELLAEVQELDREHGLLHEEDGRGEREAPPAAAAAAARDHLKHAAAVAVLQPQADGGGGAEDRVEGGEVGVAEGAAYACTLYLRIGLPWIPFRCCRFWVITGRSRPHGAVAWQQWTAAAALRSLHPLFTLSYGDMPWRFRGDMHVKRRSQAAAAGM